MKLMLKNVRLAYAQNLFEAGTFQGEGKPAYNCTFIISPDNPAVEAIKSAEKAVAKEKWGAKADAIVKGFEANGRGSKSPLVLKDGNTKAESAGFEDQFFVSARSEQRPTTLDRNKAPVVAADGKLYSGCYVNAQVEVWAQDNSYGKRLNTQLLGVQFVRDGDSFGGGSRPADPDAFDDLSAEDDEMAVADLD
jgi:hypothetical protein